MNLRPYILVMCLAPAICYGQTRVGSWTDHLSFNSSECLTSGNNKVFSSAGHAILIRDLQNNTSEKLTRLDGLNETKIKSIAWSDQEGCLVIGYSNTNIDVVKDKNITNISDIERKYISGLKEINTVRTSGKYAYFSCSFGIVILDLENFVITDTWKPGSDSNSNTVYDIAFLNGNIYAATGTGVYYASVSASGLSYFENWSRVESLTYPDADYRTISAYGGYIYASCPSLSTGTDLLYRISTGGSSALLYSEENRTIRSVEAGSGGILVTTNAPVMLLSETGTIEKTISTYSWGSPNANQSISYKGAIWIADQSVGLVETTDYSSFNNYVLDGPYTNNVADIVITDSKTFVTGGAVTSAWGNVYRPLQVFNLSGDSWNNKLLYGTNDRDAMRVAVDPKNSSHYFVSSWGNGIYEFLDGEMIKNYNQDNSPLTSILPGGAYCRVCGLAFDKNDNLWVVQSGVQSNLKMLKPDGTWVTTGLTLSAPVAGEMVIAQNGFIWVTLPKGYGVLVYDPANTPDNTNDDKYEVLQVEDATRTVLNQIYSIAEDLDGNIWLGTDAGPAVYYTPEKAFTSGIKVTRIKIPRNDGSGLADYLLSTETITSVAIDGANRKWFGTLSSGVYFVSEDCLTQLKSFNTSNSPLLSDQIVKIAIDGEDGEVLFGTADGMISYRGTATSGENNYSGLYVFPNPVRETFTGVVTITGLVENSTVKITDISGNLVFEGTSTGGQLTWDMLNYKGKRVNTGVYLVFCSNSDGSLSSMTKMLIIR
jgi:hypothetical protein